MMSIRGSEFRFRFIYLFLSIHCAALPQAIQNVDELVSSWEQIWRKQHL